MEYTQTRLEITGFSNIKATQNTVPGTKRCSFPTDAAMSMPNRRWWKALRSRGRKEERWRCQGNVAAAVLSKISV